MFDIISQNFIARLPFLAIIFGIVVLLVVASYSIFSRRMMIKSQLRDFSYDRPSGQSVERLRAREIEGAWSKLVKTIEARGLSLTDTKNDRLEKKLKIAGFTSPSAPRIYTLIRLILVFALPTGYVLLSYYNDYEVSFLKLYLIGAILAVLGLYFPFLFVQARADRRTEAIVNGFPDCLDLMLVCVEAGLGLEASMDRVGREMVKSHPLVAELLLKTVLRFRAGASREEAFRKLADDASVDEIRSFTTLLIQSDKLGTSIGKTLRIYAAEMREKRRMRAEEKAHRLPVLISIPLVACMLPTMIGTLMLPAVVMVVRKIFPLLSG